MQEITKTEIRWLLGLLEKECINLSDDVQGNFSGEPLRELVGLRYANLSDLKEKLNKSIKQGSKRIAIMNV